MIYLIFFFQTLSLKPKYAQPETRETNLKRMLYFYDYWLYYNIQQETALEIFPPTYTVAHKVGMKGLGFFCFIFYLFSCNDRDDGTYSC